MKEARSAFEILSAEPWAGAWASRAAREPGHLPLMGAEASCLLRRLLLPAPPFKSFLISLLLSLPLIEPLTASTGGVCVDPFTLLGLGDSPDLAGAQPAFFPLRGTEEDVAPGRWTGLSEASGPGRQGVWLPQCLSRLTEKGPLARCWDVFTACCPVGAPVFEAYSWVTHL